MLYSLWRYGYAKYFLLREQQPKVDYPPAWLSISSVGDALNHQVLSTRRPFPPLLFSVECNSSSKSPKDMANIFSIDSKRIWEAIPTRQKTQILNNVWCGHCVKTTTIVRYKGRMEGRNLVLDGECGRCGGKVARLIENE